MNAPASIPGVQIHCDFDQGSERWLQARCGLLTASEFDRLITADARAVTGTEFLDAILGPRKMSREEEGERALAWFECRTAMLERKADYWAQQAHDEECRARFRDRLNEIGAKFSVVEVEHLGPGRIAA
jgi:hypothetical protein